LDDRSESDRYYTLKWLVGFKEDFFGVKDQRELRRIMPIVRRANELDEQFKSLSDDDLRAKTAAWKKEISAIPGNWKINGKSWNEILPEAFAVVKNAGAPPEGTAAFLHGV